MRLADLIAVMMPSGKAAADSATDEQFRDFLRNGNHMDVRSIERIEIKKSRTPHVLSPSERAELERAARAPSHANSGGSFFNSPYDSYFSNIIRQRDELRGARSGSQRMGSEIDFSDSHKSYWFRPDSTEMAHRLMGEAKLSVWHLFEFLDGSLHQPKFKFGIPQQSQDVNFRHWDTVYLVADFGYAITLECRSRDSYRKEKFEMHKHEGVSGGTGITADIIRTGDGYRVINHPPLPIFYQTSGSSLEVMISPAVDVLHRSLASYTLENADRELGILSMTQDAANSLFQKHLSRQRKFAYAVAVIWIKKYNQHRNFGFSDLDLKKTVDSYERKNQHSGTARLIRRVEEFGVPESVEMYAAGNPALFRGIK